MTCDDVEAAVDDILRRVGKDMVLALPLGLGKPVPLVNALYRRVQADPTLRLKILTALTLERPRREDPVERAFLEPFVERVYGNCPDPDYATALREDRLPPNIEICEFFFRPGSLLESTHAQQHYISSNYTHAARDAVTQGCNVVAQMVARRFVDGAVRYSLSCNPDVTPELVDRLRRMGREFVTVAVVNENLPYMVNEAEVPADFFDVVVEHPRYSHTLFSSPKMPVSAADFLIGLNASALIRDGGSLQVGIGELGDALLHAVLLRHRENPTYRGLLSDSGLWRDHESLVRDLGGTGPFARGLYGASEMLVDGFMDLHKAGILKRRVYGFWALQQLINDGRCDPERLSPDVLEAFESLGVRVIRGQDFDILQYHGLFTDGTRYDHGHIVATDGNRVLANVADPHARSVMGERCLGTKLRRGTVVDAAFFLGTTAFYDWLRSLDEPTRAAFGMAGVNKINQLDRNPRLLQQQRLHARFLNAALKVTLSGEVASDGLEDGRVISGVGGQYNFIAMAHQLATGRAILMLRATRDEEGHASTNIVPRYGHCTIPRHLRDLVVTEYGIADLRSRTDSEIAKALLNIADSRFQGELLAQAQRAGKVEAGYRIPDAHRHNTPERLRRLLEPHAVLFGEFPLGTDFTEQEQVLMRALRGVKARAHGGRLRMLWDALRVREVPYSANPYLERMRLNQPANLRARVVRKLLVLELRRMDAI